MLTFDSYESGEILVLTVEESGYAMLEGRTGNREWLYNLVQARTDGRFAVDLSTVTFLSSTDFGILISLKRRIDSKGGRLALFGVNSFIMDTLQTMRLAGFFTIVPDFPAAQVSLRA